VCKERIEGMVDISREVLGTRGPVWVIPVGIQQEEGGACSNYSQV
jgi:hypothetical protein